MDNDEDLVQTQESTQDTQESTQEQPEQNAQDTSHLWGFLQPCLSQSLARREFGKHEPEIQVGRNLTNNFILPGFKISNFHAVITWNGLENAHSIITIDDLSSNGTFINGEKIGKNQRRILKDGSEVAFGVASTSRESDGIFDYRYIFRDLVSTVEKRALYHAYDISSELGKGSFATVYKALHKASGEWVAVKVIHETKRHAPTSGPPPTSSREISIMEELRHPNICMLREVFWNANGSIDLVLELITGGDLLDFILKRNGLDEETAKHITYQLCQSLAYIHGKGITHRDLKPENVLLTSDDPPIVKVADFGLAKIVDSMTMLKTMCGTPSYLAPEVVTQQNSSGYDSLVDSWSVGVILFSMLTNTTPFIENTNEDLKVRIAQRIIDWSQLEGMDLSLEATDFIRQLLEFDPRRRMRLSTALTHPWLDGYELQIETPLAYPAVATTPTAGSTVSEDVSMRTAEELSFHLRLHGSSAALLPSTAASGDTEPLDHGRLSLTPPSNTPPSLPLVKRGALQRRSEVIQHAAETGQSLVEPSWEMVSYANSQSSQQPKKQDEHEQQVDGPLSPSQEELYGPPRDGDVACVVPTPKANGKTANAEASGSGSVTSNGKGSNKRARPLTPLPEDGHDDGDDDERGERGRDGDGGEQPVEQRGGDAAAA
ncbi:CAMK/RAD53 protein kinase [Mycena filopes]|nr:CAMK/RAD53 protein kinase [Mycena filopes]